MSFWQRLFQFLFGWAKKRSAKPAPARRKLQPVDARPGSAPPPPAPPPPPRQADLPNSIRAEEIEPLASPPGEIDFGPSVDASTIPAAVAGSYLDTLVARDMTPLTDAQIAASAQRLQCEEAAVRAVLKVESRGNGFGQDGRPLILYEPHVFSRLTGRKYDASHPTISYRTWRTLPYPRTQAERYEQLAQAFELDSEAALGAASWGLFQILGSNHRACGFETASAFVADISLDHERQLLAFEGFVRANRLVDDLQRRDWAGFAKVYNGPGQVETYSRLLADAYREAGGTQPSAGPSA